jgi:3-deoxy-D-manno-octulosonic-acid transferase
MQRAVAQVFGAEQKRVLVLLETEIWPGLLAACHSAGVKVLILNARMTEKSYMAYKIIVPLLRIPAPKGILATSQENLQRFCRIFANTHNIADIALMRNIKFDRINSGLNLPEAGQRGLIVLASVREEEEKLLLPVIPRLLQFPLVIAPRHMHRTEAWCEALRGRGHRFIRRSAFAAPEQVEYRPGQALVWDVFGELDQLYALADAVFVGGSLVPLGGQNFLEPLARGICPCIGAYWSNFYWVGRELFDLKLVTQVKDGEELADCLLRTAQNPRPKSEALREFRQYLEPRLGGTKQAVNRIFQELVHI